MLDGGETTGALSAEDVERLAAVKSASEEAGAFWLACAKDGVGTHPFLVERKIKPNGTRIGKGDIFDRSLKDVDCLIMAVRPAHKSQGKPTLQAIAPDGEVYHYPGIPTEGAYSQFGSEKTDGPIVFCTDFASAASIHEATGWFVIACLYGSNMKHVAVWAKDRWSGREMIVAGSDITNIDPDRIDHDREAAIDMAYSLGSRIALPELHGIVGSTFADQFRDVDPESVKDTLERAIGPGDLSTSADVPLDPEPVVEPASIRLDIFSPADWAGTKAKPREWMLEGLIPIGESTLMTGAGAVGKSLATQQMSTCIAMGVPFLGIKTRPAIALYVTCEDDLDELHRRQEAICATLRIPIAETRGRLFLLSLKGKIGNELATFDVNRKMHVADRFHEIEETCRAVHAQHATLDNTAHFYSGNENVRNEVANFVNLTNHLAEVIGGSVVNVGHPNKAGDSYSGSTAWENQVRSRLFMETPKDADGILSDPDLRVLRNEKANYSRRGSEVRFYWFNGAFVLEDDISEDDRKRMAESAAKTHDDGIFLKLLDQLTRERRHVSHSPSAGNFAPKVMAAMTEARGMAKATLHAAMERLFRDEQIAASQPLWIGKDRHPVHGISRTRAPREDEK